jgi:hypothetical protein
MGRQEERGGITEATGEDAMDSDVFRTTEQIVSNKREDTSFVEFLKSGSRDTMLGHKMGDGTGLDNHRFDTRCVVTEDRNVTVRVGSWDMENAISFGGKSFAIGRDHTGTTRAVRSEATVQMEVGSVMGSGCLSSIVKMGAGPVKTDV